ncbi:hypothetical protein SAMN05192574_10530 [Mucilaginibacter gossypiicola]|uniref:Uncharacterized protein n=1 Tax=Mucilaginibacter gossypiicola TaxID=551995 RepID=A0A1H8LC13_9SPHI|nr:hypothetical protein [Mucilaginibacter gossypiicola]SEO02702.1 hypothetical protein SAMN05192574_10530 [Mucilaginibacter gossypiicola]
MGAKYLKYINNGKEGHVIYGDGDIELKFLYELAIGRCIAIIYIPTVDSWHNKTGIATGERQDIIEFIAKQAAKDQAPNATYELYDDCISLLQETDQ